MRPERIGRLGRSRERRRAKVDLALDPVHERDRREDGSATDPRPATYAPMTSQPQMLIADAIREVAKLTRSSATSDCALLPPERYVPCAPRAACSPLTTRSCWARRSANVGGDAVDEVPGSGCPSGYPSCCDPHHPAAARRAGQDAVESIVERVERHLGHAAHRGRAAAGRSPAGDQMARRRSIGICAGIHARATRRRAG